MGANLVVGCHSMLIFNMVFMFLLTNFHRFLTHEIIQIIQRMLSYSDEQILMLYNSFTLEIGDNIINMEIALKERTIYNRKWQIEEGKDLRRSSFHIRCCWN